MTADTTPPLDLDPTVLAAALGQPAPTDEQAAVIAAPTGPALVVAGAGSGKTETMAGRVVWLVATGRVRREEVLGLTFTRKAAGELGERVRLRLARLSEFERRGLVAHLPQLYGAGDLARLAGAGAARRAAVLDRLADAHDARPQGEDTDELLHRATVATYNGFADTLMRDTAVRQGRDPDAVVLNESAAWLLMRRIVETSDDPRLEHLDAAVTTIVDAALRIARDGVDNLAALDDVDAFAERFQRVRDLPSTTAGTRVLSVVGKAADTVDALRVLTGLARRYTAEKRRRGVIDFSDQIAGAYAAVVAHPDVAADLRDRYRAVLLDEYQDTSVVQTRLLATIFAGTDVMAVGDPHQAIYGWRGASAGNLGDFSAAFAPTGDARRFSLLTSWRNGVAVLDAAAAVLEPLAAHTPVEVGRLRPRPCASSGVVDIRVPDDLDTEADTVASWFADVRAERAAAGHTTSGAVLLRNRRHLDRFAQALAARGIPHRVLGLGGLLSTPEVVDVVSTLRVLSQPEAGSALIRLLSGPRWSIGVADLRALADLARRLVRHDSALRPLAPEVVEALRRSASDDRGSLTDALDFVLTHDDGHGWLADFSDIGRARLREAGAVFATLRASVALPVPDLLRRVIAELRLDIELAANEARGPARTAQAQLHAFAQEVAGFLAADETGSPAALLAWLDHAEHADDLAVRQEPAEEGVVQLLTIHGSKGLEWDAVAVARMTDGELPGRFTDGKGWLAFGTLPYEFRGDRDWLPVLPWRKAQTQQEMRDAMGDFTDALRERHLREERRLAYVAVTRARDRLLLTSSPWAGTKKPRTPSVFLREIGERLGIPVPDAPPAEDPRAGVRRILEWPMDPLGARRHRVEAAAQAARDAAAGPALTAEDDLALLLAEREERRHPSAARAPVRLPASRYKDFVADYDAAVAELARPLPERPYRQTRLGTLFHAWVERRSGLAAAAPTLDEPLWEDDDADDQAPVSASDAEALRQLQDNFSRSEWADLAPLEVETEIDFRFVGVDGVEHLAICKLDAVYRRGERIQIVDWKTGRAPRTAQERRSRMLQLELYRRAYHERHGVPEDRIDVALYYVAHDLVLRG